MAVGGLPGGEAAVGAVEAAMRASLGRADERADQVEIAETGGDPEVPRVGSQQPCDFAVTPEERLDQGRAAVAARGQVGARAGGEQQLRKVAVVPVPGLVQLRPAVVVAAIRVGAATEQQRRDLRVAGHPQQVVAVRPALGDQVGESIEQAGQELEVVVLDRPVGEHERRRRLLTGAHRLDVAAESGPAREAVPGGEVPAGPGDRDVVDRRDPFRPAFVVVEVSAERLFKREALEVGLELRPALEPQLARELELDLRQLHLLPRRAALAHAVLRLLAQLLEIELKRHHGSLPSRRGSAWSGWRGSSFTSPTDERVGSALSGGLDAALAAPRV